MVAPGRIALGIGTRILPWLAVVAALPGCGTTGDLVRTAWRKGDDQVRLPEAEQMIDELDRILTLTGTISVKSPDVWGQDRLAKFRSEYEDQMSQWLKGGFKGELNAAQRRTESESLRLRLGTSLTDPAAKGAGEDPLDSWARSTPGDNGASIPAAGGEKAAAALEPTVVVDEHSNYLNHINQLRRINAGDDLTDRPGYGLYLVRMPVTLSPGPRSRRGKGAIITVSARSLMTRDTLRNTLRNVVINETVNNLTQILCNQPGAGGEPSSGPASSPFSLVSYADAELSYGPRNIDLLRSEAEHQLARELADEPHHRAARIAEWLRGELEASYRSLEQAAAPVRVRQILSAIDPLEEIGELVEKRDYAKLASLRSEPAREGQVLRAGGQLERAAGDDPVGRRKEATGFLAFALKIQAAAVNRRLKQDMVDQDPTLRQQNLKNTSFFDPEAPEEVMRLFEKYVDAKWPLRVYAIEPVIAQQNVADAFGRRNTVGLDLAASAPVHPLKLVSGLAAAGLAADRRITEDETAIRLNPTMVGFGAGESTFGWVFYPRIQTPMRDGRLRTDLALLARGQLPDPTGKDQSIEPGQRECTALIVMPNFVPRIEFITVANWFRTSEVGDGQKSDLEKASTLGRRLVAAENALNRAKVEGQFRPEEYQIALERINQLRSMMPTQRMVVRVPFSEDNNDSRIFCSQGGQLRPSLLAWHGKPPMEGEESTILIEGKNFSVHDTHVIAGGKPAKAVLVSRTILQVTIAKDACPTPGGSGQPLLDVSVATPNGVSNHLLIRMRPGCADRKPADGDKPAKDEQSKERRSITAETKRSEQENAEVRKKDDVKKTAARDSKKQRG
jgi:hypothetical protein